ncbi:hypothetical protein ACWDWU_01550 [Streptomyces sp. NPDC003442]
MEIPPPDEPSPDLEGSGRLEHPRTEQLPDRLRTVGPDWHPLLLRLHEQLLAIDPGYEVDDLKENLGAILNRRGDAMEGWSKAVCNNCHRAWSQHTVLIINGSVRHRESGQS